MMGLYFVKRPLYGIPEGRVERFHASRAGILLQDGSIEPFSPDNKRHQNAPGAPKPEEAKRKG